MLPWVSPVARIAAVCAEFCNLGQEQQTSDVAGLRCLRCTLQPPPSAWGGGACLGLTRRGDPSIGFGFGMMLSSAVIMAQGSRGDASAQQSCQRCFAHVCTSFRRYSVTLASTGVPGRCGHGTAPASRARLPCDRPFFCMQHLSIPRVSILSKFYVYLGCSRQWVGGALQDVLQRRTYACGRA